MEQKLTANDLEDLVKLVRQMQEVMEEFWKVWLERIHELSEAVREIFAQFAPLFRKIVLKVVRFRLYFTLRIHWHFPHGIAEFISDHWPERCLSSY
jgi:uncharacterized protein YecE (DUF72 family)